MKLKFEIFNIPEKDKENPTVVYLMEIIQQQAEQIEKLKDEINRIKKHPRKPNIKPSRLSEKEKKAKSKKRKQKTAGSKQRKKTAELKIHKDKPIEPEHVPDGSRFVGYKDFVVQGIKFEPYNIRYRRKVYETPGGCIVIANLPEFLNGKHFSPELISFILYQHFHCHVTQPLLLEQLWEIGIDISSGQLNNILVENKERFHREKDEILAAGLGVSAYVNVDDTGARHKGKNGYCTHIGNEMFSWFESTESKSRINFLKLMRAGCTDYTINPDAFSYMLENRLPDYVQKTIAANMACTVSTDEEWDNFLDRNGIVKEYHKKIVTEGALIGSIIEHGIGKQLVIVSDDAGQFNVFIHALCWIHAERTIQKIIPYTDQARKDLEEIQNQIWQLYEGLKQYKEKPNSKDKRRLETMFDHIFTTKTASELLNQALKRIHQNKDELLLVLKRPEIPLHNNGAENPIREYVKRRKISGGTRSESGRMARDTFTSLKKTCRKLGISFWQYLIDRTKKIGEIPPLPDLIRNAAIPP
jgi:hypothetical protein